MRGEQHPSRVALSEARHTAIDQLSSAFVKDQLSLEEFEERVDAAFRCNTPAEFEKLVADLDVGSERSTAELVRVAADEGAGHGATALVEHDSASSAPPRVGMAVLGNVERRGQWSLPKSSRALAVLGNVELDLRDVVLADRVTELRVRAVFGNVEIVVPPHWVVQTEGSGILGSFSSMSRGSPDPGTEPVLRITGSAVFGNVEIRTLPRTSPLSLSEAVRGRLR